MKPTSDNFFLDSNICLYLLSDIIHKKSIALELLNLLPIISTQVLNENINVLFKKYKHFTSLEKMRYIDFLKEYCTVEIITEDTITRALTIKERYQLQWYDSLIVAAALQAGCTTLYSEDMQHGLVVEE